MKILLVNKIVNNSFILLHPVYNIVNRDYEALAEPSPAFIHNAINNYASCLAISSQQSAVSFQLGDRS